MNLLSPLSIKESPQDIWGNVKIPTYESLRTEAESGFKPVPSGNGTDWISLIGLPLTGLDRRARVNSTISTWYYYVNCSHMEGVHNTTNWTAKFGLPKDATNKNAWNTSQWKIFFSGKYDSTGYPESPPVTMLFASWSGEINGHNGVYYPANVTIGNCSIEPSYVDVKVVCKDLSCHAEGARRSSINRPPVNSSSGTAQAWWGELLEGPGENVIRNPSDSFLSPWTTSDNASIAGQISPTLNYIAGTEAFPFAAPVDDHFLGYQAITTAPELHKLDVDAVARRLRRLLNTYWQASTGPQSHNAAVPKDSPAMKSAANTYLDSTLSMALSDATFEHDARVYHCDTSWLAITLIVSGIVLVVGFVGLVASCACVGPDLLNSFTTALRSNPNTAKSLNGDNSTLDSSEVAKANRNIVVALQDVRPDEDVGLLAIGTGNDRSGSRKNVSDARRRNEGRFYD